MFTRTAFLTPLINKKEEKVMPEKKKWMFLAMIITLAVAWIIITAIQEYRASTPVPDVAIIPYHKIKKDPKKTTLGPIVLMYDLTSQPAEQKKEILKIFYLVQDILADYGWTEAPYLPDKGSATYLKAITYTDPGYEGGVCLFVHNQQEHMLAFIPKKNLEFMLQTILPK